MSGKPRKNFDGYFWSLVKKTESGCWEWMGGIYGQGYGRISHNGKRKPAHRVAYELLVGLIPEGMFICHHCDNKICVNPMHLFVGTQKDNMQDWTQKGKNRLVNDRSLWSNGKHWENPEVRKKLSATRKSEYASGKRKVIRDGVTGRTIGSRMTK